MNFKEGSLYFLCDENIWYDQSYLSRYCLFTSICISSKCSAFFQFEVNLKFDMLLHIGKTCMVFTLQEMRQDCQKVVQRRCCKGICTEMSSIVTFILPATIFGVTVLCSSSYLLECLYNEISWEYVKNSQKQKRGGEMRGIKPLIVVPRDKWCICNGDVWHLITHEKEGRKSCNLWGSSLKGLYKQQILHATPKRYHQDTSICI